MSNTNEFSSHLDEGGYFHSMEYQLNLYQTMVERTSDLSAVVSQDYIVQAVSDGYLERLGLQWDQALGFSLEKIHGAEIFKNDLKKAIQHAFERWEYRTEIMLDFPVGGRRCLDLVFRLVEVKEGESITQLCSIVGRDVTELRNEQQELEETNKLLLKLTEEHKEAKNRINSILENLPGCIYRCVTFKDGRSEYNYISSGVEKLLGYTNVEIMKAPEVLFRAAHPEDQRNFQEACKNSLENNEPFFCEYRLLQKGGNYIWVRDIANPHPGANGSVIWNSLLLDITEQKELELQLIQASKLESIGQLACGIAHEINTPSQFVADNLRFLNDSFGELLSAIETPNSSNEAMTATSIDEEELDFLQREIPDAITQSIDGINRISQIVSAMKFFAHPGTEVKDTVDIVHVLKDAAAISCNSWKYCATLEVIPDSEEILIQCFPAELGQVIVNLIINAAHAIEDRFGTDNDGRITINVRQVDDTVRIIIEDNGCGISEHVKAKIFDPFFTTKKVGRGTGQGLAIVQKIIMNDHNGQISLESTVGEGSRFEISIPVNSNEVMTTT